MQQELIIKYIPLQQGLRQNMKEQYQIMLIIKYIPLQQGLRLTFDSPSL